MALTPDQIETWSTHRGYRVDECNSNDDRGGLLLGGCVRVWPEAGSSVGWWHMERRDAQCEDDQREDARFCTLNGLTKLMDTSTITPIHIKRWLETCGHKRIEEHDDGTIQAGRSLAFIPVRGGQGGWWMVRRGRDGATRIRCLDALIHSSNQSKSQHIEYRAAL